MTDDSNSMTYSHVGSDANIIRVVDDRFFFPLGSCVKAMPISFCMYYTKLHRRLKAIFPNSMTTLHMNNCLVENQTKTI